MTWALQVALIGAGRVARTHGDGFARQGAKIRMVADPRIAAAEELAAEYGAAAVEDYTQILSSREIDAVDIIVPHDLHAPIAKLALQHGKHVFMDKPLATTVEEGRELSKLAEAGDTVFMVCHNILFHPVIVAGIELLAEGILGRPTNADAWSHGWLDLPPWDFRRSRQATGGGAWVDGAPHLVYTLEALLGPIDELGCLHTTGDSRMDAEDSSVGMARFAGGHAATLRVSYADRLPGHEQGWPAAWRMGFDLHGTAGRLLLEILPMPRIVAYHGHGEPETRNVEGQFQASFHRAIEEFVCAVREGRPARISAKDSFRTLSQVLNAPR